MNDFAQLTALSKHSGDLTQRPPLKITAGTQKQMEANDVAFKKKKKEAGYYCLQEQVLTNAQGSFSGKDDCKNEVTER